MVLMQIVAIMRQNEIRRQLMFQLFKIFLEFTPCIREESISKIFNDDGLGFRMAQEHFGAFMGFVCSLLIRAKNNPMAYRVFLCFQQPQYCSATSYFDIVTVCPETQNPVLGLGLLTEAQFKHR